MTIIYQYDGGGNRVQKTVQKGEFISVTHYVRDASGNILATYNNEKQVKEFNIYSSSRIGNYKPENLIDDKGKLILGYRNYELTNHLSNVLAVISDKKLGDFTADIIIANDYYPFGMTMKNRSSSSGYRFGFNGKENDKDFGEGIQDYGFRLYDRRNSRFLSTDPLFQSYPWYTPYQFAGNKPIVAIDLDGLEEAYRINSHWWSAYLTAFDDNQIILEILTNQLLAMEFTDDYAKENFNLKNRNVVTDMGSKRPPDETRDGIWIQGTFWKNSGNHSEGYKYEDIAFIPYDKSLPERIGDALHELDNMIPRGNRVPWETAGFGLVGGGGVNGFSIFIEMEGEDATHTDHFHLKIEGNLSAADAAIGHGRQIYKDKSLESLKKISPKSTLKAMTGAGLFFQAYAFFKIKDKDALNLINSEIENNGTGWTQLTIESQARIESQLGISFKGYSKMLEKLFGLKAGLGPMVEYNEKLGQIKVGITVGLDTGLDTNVGPGTGKVGWGIQHNDNK